MFYFSAMSGQTKVPIDLHQHTENIMLEAMKRKRQQEILKSQMKINENNQRNCINTNSFDFRRFSLNQQQQQQQLNGMFNPKQTTTQQLQSSINSLMLAKSNSDIMQIQQNQLQNHQQQQQQQTSMPQQYPYRGMNFPINQQATQIRQNHQNPFMGRPILKGSLNMNSMNQNSCPTEASK